MIDAIRENLSYFGLYKKMHQQEKIVQAQRENFGQDKTQYFLFYEPAQTVSNKLIVWIHGGGWNSGSPTSFDFVGQRVAQAGYRFVSLGYRLSPFNKYPCQIEDVCAGYNAAMTFLERKGIDISKVIVSGPSAGAHLASILCYSRKIQECAEIDASHIAGFIGVGGPYSFSGKQTLAVKMLLHQLFEKGYDRTQGEPLSLMDESDIPMLLIQSQHDGLIAYSCAEDFCSKAKRLGIDCELYSVTDKKNTHSWYTAGMFLFARSENKALNKFFTWIENI